MNVLFIFDSEYPWDIRVDKITTTLRKNGMTVHILCRNKSRLPTEDLYKKIYIHRIPFLDKKFKNINDFFTFPAFFNPVWIIKIKKVCKLNDIELIIVRDLPLSLTAIAIGKICNIPVIIDMAECYPEFTRLIWRTEKFKLSNIFVRNPLIVSLIEYISIHLADHIFVMVKESKNRLIQKNINAKRITIVSNTPETPKIDDKKYCNKIYDNQKNEYKKLKIIYTGYLDHTRDLNTIFKAINLCNQNKKNILFEIIGSGSAENYFREIVKKMKLSKNIRFYGWIENKKLRQYINNADICIIPHSKSGHWDNTVPNKLFDYMACGKPIIAADAAPIKRILEEEKCGAVYKSSDFSDLYYTIKEIYENDSTKKYGENCVRAIGRKYNWGKDSKRMLDSIKRLADKKRNNSGKKYKI